MTFGAALVGLSMWFALFDLARPPAHPATSAVPAAQAALPPAALTAPNPSSQRATPALPDIPAERIREREIQVTILRVPEGISASEIASILEYYGVVESADAFLRLARQRGVTTRLVAGTYHFVDGEAIDQVLDRLAPSLLVR